MKEIQPGTDITSLTKITYFIMDFLERFRGRTHVITKKGLDPILFTPKKHKLNIKTEVSQSQANIIQDHAQQSHKYHSPEANSPLSVG